MCSHSGAAHAGGDAFFRDEDAFMRPGNENQSSDENLFRTWIVSLQGDTSTEWQQVPVSGVVEREAEPDGWTARQGATHVKLFNQLAQSLGSGEWSIAVPARLCCEGESCPVWA